MYEPRQAPGFAPEYSTAASGGQMQYKLLKPEYASKVDIRKPAYDKNGKSATVFRPFPCRSYADPMNSFEPYRCDPGGANYFGYWIHKMCVAWNVGNPATTFIIQPPSRSNIPFDMRATPLGILHRAVSNAVKKGKGKGDQWGPAVQRAFQPPPGMLLLWDGATEGDQNKSAILTWPQYIHAMQGALPYHGGKNLTDSATGIPGFGNNPTCMFLLTQGPSNLLLSALNAEKPGFRGDPADFENRYVYGDPVALEHGCYVVVYPKGGDPRQNVMYSQPVDPMAAPGGFPGFMPGASATQPAKKEDGIGFDLHVERSCHLLAKPGYHPPTAALVGPEMRAIVRDKWIPWEDMLYYPTAKEQAALLGGILPASMLVYAFEGEHSDWLTDDIRDRARIELGAQLPAAAASYQSSPLPSIHGYGQSPQVSVSSMLPFGGAAQPLQLPASSTAPVLVGQLRADPVAAGSPFGGFPSQASRPSVETQAPAQYNPNTPVQPPTSQPAASQPTPPTQPVQPMQPGPVSQAPGLVPFPPQDSSQGAPATHQVWGASMDQAIVPKPGALDRHMDAAMAASQLPSFAPVEPPGKPTAAAAAVTMPTDPAELARQLAAMQH